MKITARLSEANPFVIVGLKKGVCSPKNVS
jgi:hypothetical protein